jgi:hypothetical protein
MTKNQRAAVKADGFVNYYHTPANIRANREGLRGDIAESDYFGDLAPTVVWVPDCLVAAWAELYGDEVDLWMDIVHQWPGRHLRHISNATALVTEFHQPSYVRSHTLDNGGVRWPTTPNIKTPQVRFFAAAWTKFVRDMTTGPCRQVSTKLFRKWSEKSRGLNTVREEARYE